MHSAIVAGSFLLLILIPCLAAVYSSSKEGSTGNSGEHAAAPAEAPAARPSRVRMVAKAAFGKDNAPAGKRVSRVHRVATALKQRDVKAPIPMVAGDPGERRQSIRDLRAKHGATPKSARSRNGD